MAYTAKTERAFREEKGSLSTKIATELALIAAESISGAAAAVNDGDTITHGMATTPTAVVVSGSVATEMISVTAIGAANFTVAIKTALGAAGTAQTIYWMARK